MQLRSLASLFFLVYGALIPILASRFVQEYTMASLALIGSCLLLATILWIGRPVLINILIALYVFRIYLTKPYTTIFLDNLDASQLAYLDSLHDFFIPRDATVVYVSLFSLLLAWVFGLVVTKPRRILKESRPFWIFRQVDRIVASARKPFYLVWLALAVLGYQRASDIWQGIAADISPGPVGSPLFAYGLLSLAAINTACLYAFIRSRQTGHTKLPLTLLFPVAFFGSMSILGGGRSAIFSVVLIALSYWLFINYRVHLNIRRTLRLASLIVIIFPAMVFAGLFAQELRSVLRSGADAETVDKEVLKNLDWEAASNPVVKNLQFNITRLLYRLSSLQQPFLIMNDHFIHQPWDHYNPLTTSMRIVNDLVPGEVFPGVLTINQLFAYIYFNTIATYRSDMWSIQGTLYLYFGFWFSPIVVFCLACFATYNAVKWDSAFRASPSLTAVFIALFSDFLENGTLERVIVVDVVRPLASFLAIIFLVKLFRLFFMMKIQKLAQPAHR